MAIKEQSMIQVGLTRILCPSLLTVWFRIGHSAPLSLFLTWKIWIIMVIELLWDQTEAPIMITALQISSVLSFSRVWLFATPWTAARQASLSITNSGSLLKLMSIVSVMPSNHLILCHPRFLLPSIYLSQHQGLFEWVSSLHQVAKVLEFQLQHQSFQWIFRTDFL